MNFLKVYGKKVRHGKLQHLSMRILVTGAFGFIGSRLSQHLKRLGHNVILGSRKIDTSPPWLPQAEVFEINWDENSSLLQACDGVDVVIHAAGMNSRDCMENPVKALEFNGLGTARLVEYAVKSRVKRFIYLSTAHVYSSQLVGKINEHTCPQNKHPYATSHLAAENVILSANRNGIIEGVVVRLSNVYGTPAHPKANCWMLLVNDLCRQGIQNKKLVLRTSGAQRRDFISMTKVIEILSKLATEELSNFHSDVLNVGAGFSQSVLEMANFIQERCEFVIGHTPEVILPNVSLEKQPEDLIYESCFLTKEFFSESLDLRKCEIDSLLKFCNNFFK
jgi:UDP-glucose 4-epimerase